MSRVKEIRRPSESLVRLLDRLGLSEEEYRAQQDSEARDVLAELEVEFVR